MYTKHRSYFRQRSVVKEVRSQQEPLLRIASQESFLDCIVQSRIRGSSFPRFACPKGLQCIEAAVEAYDASLGSIPVGIRVRQHRFKPVVERPAPGVGSKLRTTTFARAVAHPNKSPEIESASSQAAESSLVSTRAAA